MDETNDYADFVGEVVDDLEGVAAGIARRVSATGTERNLTPRQRWTLFHAIREWMNNHTSKEYLPTWNEELPLAVLAPQCSECPEDIPWCEVYVAMTFNSGRCSYCEQVHHKPEGVEA